MTLNRNKDYILVENPDSYNVNYETNKSFFTVSIDS